MPPEKTPRERAEDLIHLLVPDWRPTPRQVLWAIRIGIVLGILVPIGYSYGVTLWDWIKILIVPAAIAIGVAWLNQAQERERRAQEAHREDEREAEAEQRERAREITEEARREREREAQAAQRERELEVENCVPKTRRCRLTSIRSQLLADPERPLRRARPGDALSMLARARTLTVLQRVESGLRKRSVVQFLYEAGLITKDHVVVELRGANLAKANLTDADLKGASLRGAYLARANLTLAKLSEADLRDTKLFGANLQYAELDDANLRGAEFIGDGRSRPLPRVSRTGSLPVLHGPGPQNANMEYADLSGADLTDAYVSEEQLYSTGIFNLQGATLPHGQTYEDWLPYRQRREEDVENE